MGVLQVRIDDELKNQANEIFNELGIDLSTAVRMFLKRAVAVKGLPFEMTLDEINEEIRLAREERRKRKEVK